MGSESYLRTLFLANEGFHDHVWHGHRKPLHSTDIAVVLPGFRDYEMVTSLMVALTSEKNVSWYLTEGSRIS
jgi:hypothetical protein